MCSRDQVKPTTDMLTLNSMICLLEFDVRLATCELPCMYGPAAWYVLAWSWKYYPAEHTTHDAKFDETVTGRTLGDYSSSRTPALKPKVG